MFGFIRRMFDYNAKELKALQALTDRVSALADEARSASDEELQARTAASDSASRRASPSMACYRRLSPP